MTKKGPLEVFGERGRDNGISRRAIISGLAAVGAGSAVSGAGAAVLYGDTDSRSTTPISGNVGNLPFEGFHDTARFGTDVVQTGSLDLDVCWEKPDEDCEPGSGPTTIDFGEVQHGDSGTGTLRCRLQDNSGWVWLRTSCPEDACGLEKAVEVTLWYDDGCDGTIEDGQVLAVNGTEIENERLCDALSLLREGVLLDGDLSGEGAAPLDPGDACCIGIEWEVVEPICVADESLDVTFEFSAEQRRHNARPANPWPGAECEVVCDYSSCRRCAEDFQGIHSVAFCIDDGSIEPGDIEFSPTRDVDGDPYRVDWRVAEGVELSYVVLTHEADQGFVFENFWIGSATSGFVAVGGRSDENTIYDSRKVSCPDGDAGCEPSVTCVSSENCETKTDCQTRSSPCPCDADCGVKYDFGDATWDDVCQ